MQKLSTVITLLVFTLCASSIQAAQFRWYSGNLTIDGVIDHGDYEKIIQIAKYFDEPFLSVTLNSPGGNVLEAIKIGRLLNKTLTPVSIYPKSICASSCFLILVGSPSRTLINESIGIHRPYFEPSYFASLSASAARKHYDELQRDVTQYLLDMGVPRNFIDMMYTISSKEVKWITTSDFENIIGEKKPFYEELLLSKCGGDLSEAESKSFESMDRRFLCEININSAERAEFSKNHGLKHENPHDSKRMVDIYTERVNNKVIISKVVEVKLALPLQLFE